jgi:putative membrane protein
MGWDGTGWGMGWGWLFFLLLLAGVVLLVVAVVRLLSGEGRGSKRGPGGTHGPAHGVDRAREILDERYARGEIDAAEYQERLRVLREGR